MVALELSQLIVWLCLLIRLCVLQAKRCLAQRNFHRRSPCPLRRVAAVVYASKQAALCASRHLSRTGMPLSGVLRVGNNRCCMRSTFVKHISASGATLRAVCLLPQSGTKCTERQTMHSGEEHALNRISCKMSCAFCSCVCTVVCSCCSRASAPCTERHHEHLSSAPPHTSTPHSEQPICIF